MSTQVNIFFGFEKPSNEKERAKASTYKEQTEYIVSEIDTTG